MKKKILIIFVKVIFFTTLTFAQESKKQNTLNTGFYKYSTISRNEINTTGYYYFEKSHQYKYFGIAKYNHIGNFSNYYAYSTGDWGIDKDAVLTIKDRIDKTVNTEGLKTADSIYYTAAYREPYDSIFFDIQAFGENGTPVKRELIEIKGYTKNLLESDEFGRTRFQALWKNTADEKIVQFLGNEPYYKTVLLILTQYNYHHIKVYLKKIPPNGFLPAGFIQKNWKDKIVMINQDTVKIGKSSYFSKVSAEEIKSFINTVEKENPSFKPEFERIKQNFSFKE